MGAAKIGWKINSSLSARSLSETLSGKRKNQQKPAMARTKVNANGLSVY